MPPPRDVTPAVQSRVLIGATVGLVGGFTTAFLSTFGQFIIPLTQEFGWNRADLSLVVVLAGVGSAIASPPAGRLIVRFGARPVVLGSGVVLAASFVALANAPADLGYFALVAFLTGLLAVGTTPAALLAVVPRFFDRRLGLAFGGVMGVSAVGAAIVGIVLVGAGLQSVGWRPTYLVLAVVVVVMVGICVLIGFPKGTGPQDPGSAVTGEGLTVREALAWSRFRILIAALVLSAIGTGGLAAHYVPFMREQGVDPVAAAGAAGLAGIGVALGRFVSGVLLDRVNAVRLAGVVFLIAAVGLSAAALSSSAPVWFYALCALAGGFALGAEGDIIPFLVRRFAGMLAYPPLIGVALGAFTLGGAVGTLGFGVTRDLFGDYTPGFLGAAALMLVAAVLIQFMGPYRYPDARGDALPSTDRTDGEGVGQTADA